MYIEHSILLAYTITLVSEAVVIWCLQRPKKFKYWLVAIWLINSLTHPLAIYLIEIQNCSYILIEILVFLIEAAWYYLALNLSWRESFIISGAANLGSIITGKIINYLFSLATKLG